MSLIVCGAICPFRPAIMGNCFGAALMTTGTNGGFMREVVIVEAVRTPIGKKDGSLREVRPDDLAALALAELMRRSKIDKGLVEDVILGCVTQVEEQGW